MRPNFNIDANDLRVVSCHEAAHVIVGEFLGKHLDSVCIYPKRPNPGFTTMSWPSGKPLDSANREISISIAGPIIDLYFTKKFFLNDWDNEKIEVVLVVAGIPKSDWNTLIAKGFRCAEKIIDSNIDVILRIATILLSEKSYDRRSLLSELGQNSFFTA
jgi:hypothetical protein